MVLQMIQVGQRFRINVVAVFALFGMFMSLSGVSYAVEYVSIKLYPEHVGVFTSVMKQQFVAFGVTANGTSTNITELVGWESSDESVVTIDENGLATVVPGKTYGQVKISCSYPKSGKVQPGVQMLLLKSIR